MGRLTYMHDGKWCINGVNGKLTGDNQANYWGEAVERLAEFENTGLSPEVCAEYKAFEDEAISKGVTFKRIVELMEAERAGRLAVYPCMVGDAVYFIEKIRAVPTVSEYKVGELGQDAESCYVVLMRSVKDGVSRRMGMPVEEFRENAFFSHEEAEAALRKEETE